MAISRVSNALLGWRRDLVGPISGRILEIGAGTGANFSYYRHASAIYAIEPDENRARRALATAQWAMTGHDIPIHVQIGVAEQLPYADDSMDIAVSSLVFCSVAKPVQVLAEIRRVLRPGGTLWMVEHVRPRTPVFREMASLLTPGWRRVAHNCHLDRLTVQILRQNGWQVTVLSRRGPFVKVRANW